MNFEACGDVCQRGLAAIKACARSKPPNSHRAGWAVWCIQRNRFALMCFVFSSDFMRCRGFPGSKGSQLVAPFANAVPCRRLCSVLAARLHNWPAWAGWCIKFLVFMDLYCSPLDFIGLHEFQGSEVSQPVAPFASDVLLNTNLCSVIAARLASWAFCAGCCIKILGFVCLDRRI